MMKSILLIGLGRFGYHPRSLNSNGSWNVTSNLSFLNMPIHCYAGEIEN